MKKLNSLSILTMCLFVFMAFSASAQKISVSKGKLSALKSVKSFKTEYKYDDMKVGKKSETKYVSEKVKEKNKDEKGSGDTFEAEWYGNREARFEPKFEELFNETTKKGQIKDDAEVTMIIHTTMTEPGFNVGVMRRPCFLNLDISFVKDGKTICRVEMTKVPGADAMGFDFDTAYRIENGYAKGGKALAKYFNKKIK